MTDTLLRSLRERLLDESEPLAGLLRKCLLLGAETGSESLRDWARYELNGYDDDIETPKYRQVPVPVIKMDSISGYTVVTGQAVSRFELPVNSQVGIPNYLPLREPIEALEVHATSQSLRFMHNGLSYAQMLWNEQLEDFQQVTSLYFQMPGSAITGVLGKIRTKLIDMVADLTADTPLAELPRKEQVDAAVVHHIGAQYNTTIHTANAPTAIGTKAEAKAEGLSIEDALRLLDAVGGEASEMGKEPDHAELLAAIEELNAEAKKTAPETGAVMKKAGRLRVVANGIGVPALSAAVSAAVEAFTSLALSGAFG